MRRRDITSRIRRGCPSSASGRSRLGAIAGALLAVVLLAGPAQANQVSMGPQAMEGHLQAPVGSVIDGGFDFNVSGVSGPTTITWADAKITFTPFCSNGDTYTGPTAITMGSPSYTVNDNGAGWIPSGDQASDLVYQSIASGGSITITSSMCNGGDVDFQHGGTFTADLQGSDTSVMVAVRWHYRQFFNNKRTSGSWSGTGHFNPDQTTVPVGAVGFVALAVLAAGALAIMQRRSRRKVSGEVS